MKEKPTLADAMKKPKPKATKRAATRRGKKVLMLYLDPAISKRLKIMAAVHDTSVQALAEESFDMILEKYED